MQRLAAAVEAVCGECGSRSNGAGPATPLVLLGGDFNTTPSAAACRVRSAPPWLRYAALHFFRVRCHCHVLNCWCVWSAD